METLRCILFVLTALCVIDGHLFVGQSVAWISMIGNRAPAMGFQEAVADTFSGETPCRMCRAIKEERQDQREETPIPESRPELKFAPVIFSKPLVLPPAPDAAGLIVESVVNIPPMRTIEVPTPPPRVG